MTSPASRAGMQERADAGSIRHFTTFSGCANLEVLETDDNHKQSHSEFHELNFSYLSGLQDILLHNNGAPRCGVSSLLRPRIESNTHRRNWRFPELRPRRTSGHAVPTDPQHDALREIVPPLKSSGASAALRF